MKYTKQYISSLLESFIEGRTSETEEQILLDYFKTTDTIPDEWQVYKEMFHSFNSDFYDYSEEEMDEMFNSVPDCKKKVRLLHFWQPVACAAVALIFIALYIWNDDLTHETLTPACVEQKRSINNNKTADIISLNKNETHIIKETKPVKEKLYLETASLVDKNKKAEFDNKENKNDKIPTRKKATECRDISTSDLLEAINILTELETENAIITVTCYNDGFIVNTESNIGDTNSYTLNRCSDGCSLELISQSINF